MRDEQLTMPEPGNARKDWKDQADAHYSAQYKNLDPREIAERCNLPFEAGIFSLRLMGVDYSASFPEFELRQRSGKTENLIMDESIRVLILRYLCRGKWTAPGGRQLSYSDIPWGNLYFRNFEGRCIKRIENTFGNDTTGFSKIFEENESLRAEKLAGKECAWRFEFLSGIFISIIIWEKDEDFPAKAQILFDDNFPAAFSAEDTAVACDICISRLKKMKDKHG
ncbi:MAG: DUF3786 domain-containing protein [Spirochaetaceae bacterium]|jgi:hypothetical protein|nr:DUF3786 domain-containing protein [Spirochaetaceae bacterium]